MPVIVAAGAETPKNATVLWNTLGTISNLSTLGSAVGFPAVNILDPATSTQWKGNSNVNNWVRFDYGTPQTVDALGISAHNMGTTGIAQVSFQSSNTADVGDWINRHIFTPMSDEDIFVIIPAVAARFWRVLIFGLPAAIGIITVGKRLVFPQAPVTDYKSLDHSRVYTKMFNDSIRGQFIGNRVMAAGAETEVDLGFVKRTFADGPLRPFESHYNQGGTFFYASSPSTAPSDMGYCRAQGDEESVNVTYIDDGNHANLSFGIRSYVGV